MLSIPFRQDRTNIIAAGQLPDIKDDSILLVAEALWPGSGAEHSSTLSASSFLGMALRIIDGLLGDQAE